MSLIDNHLDVLQNIEQAFNLTARANNEIKDKHVIKTLDKLIDHFKALASNRTPPTTESLNELEQALFNNVLKILEDRDILDIDDDINNDKEDKAPRRKSFSRAFRQPTKEDIYLACMRKIQGSAKFWNKERGPRGYLNYISGFL